MGLPFPGVSGSPEILIITLVSYYVLIFAGFFDGSALRAAHHRIYGVTIKLICLYLFKILPFPGVSGSPAILIITLVS